MWTIYNENFVEIQWHSEMFQKYSKKTLNPCKPFDSKVDFKEGKAVSEFYLNTPLFLNFDQYKFEFEF